MKRCLQFLLISIITLAATAAQAQEYKFSLGVRGGTLTGISGKYFLSEKVAIEGIVGAIPDGPSITGLYELHALSKSIPNLVWFYGAGAHIQSYVVTGPCVSSFTCREKRGTGAGFGLDGIVGVEFKIPEIPITIGFDFKPNIEITTRGKFWLDLGPGLTIRYIFANDPFHKGGEKKEEQGK